MARFALPGLAIVTTNNIDVPESLVVSVPHFFLGNRRDLLICWHSRRCDVMRQEVALRADMK
jgi:hypothetical protein